MTIEEFNNYNYNYANHLIYKGKQYRIICVDRKEALFGIELSIPGEDPDYLSWIRCENITVKEKDKGIVTRKFKFWKVDFKKLNKKTKEPTITESNDFIVTGIRNADLEVRHIDFYSAHSIKERYYNLPDVEIWHMDENKKIGYIIRELNEEIDVTQMIAFIAKRESNNN